MSSATQEFWEWFAGAADRFTAIDSGDHPLMDQILEHLHAVNSELYFELSVSEEGPHELVITAGGEKALFGVADDLVNSAPPIANWTFQSLKPAMGFDFVTHFQDVEVNPRTLWFEPIPDSKNSGAVGLRVHVPNLRKADEQTVTLGVLVVLDTALGERSAGEDISFVEIRPLRGSPEVIGLTHLSDLPDFLSSRRSEARASDESK